MSQKANGGWIPPRAPLVLGLAGLLPFLWGVLTLYSQPVAQSTNAMLGPRFVAPFVLLNYGLIILAFMSGVLWGFATKATGRIAAAGYGLAPRWWMTFRIGLTVVVVACLATVAA